ncbi:MAG: hypothetical protein ACFFC6_10585 [Promethearchaeota archaeon]
MQSLNKTHYKRRWLISFLVVTAWLFGGYMKDIHQIWLDTSEDDLFSKSLLSTHSNNEDILSINSIGELRTVKVKPMILKEKIQSTYSYIEEFDNTDYLDTTGTNASGWGTGKIQLGNKQLGAPIYRDTTGDASGVYVRGDYAYVADGKTGLAIIDISDPTNPGLPIYRDTVDTAWRGVYVSGDYAYVTVLNEGLAIIDISNPTNPGSPIYRDLAFRIPYDVHVSEDYAYVAYNAFEDPGGLAVIDISNPANPGTPIYKEIYDGPTGVFIDGVYAYVADVGRGLAIINISDPTNPGTPIYRNIVGERSNIYVNGDFAYVANGGWGLAIINISDPTNPGSPIYIETNGSANEVYVDGVYAYVADWREGLAIIDVRDPTHPESPIYMDIGGTAKDVYVSGDYVYIADGDLGLVIVEVAERHSLSFVQSSSYYNSKGFIQNLTLSANQTVYPNTHINYQILSDGNTWMPINLNETYSWEKNPSHGIYWRAVLVAEDQRTPSPCIDSIRIDFDVYYDEEPPGITLINVQNNTVISPGTVIECSLSDYLLDKSWFNWNDGDDLPLTDPWTIVCPNSEDYHWLMINVNDSVGHLTTKRYQFYVNYPPLIELQSPLNNSVIVSLTEIEFLIADPTLTNAWYQWDNQGNLSLTDPFVLQTINSSGFHILTIGARDNWNSITIQTYRFCVISSSSIDITQPRPFTAYSGESFIYSITITNTEVIPLNLMLLVFSPDDDVLTGNSSHFVLNPRENITVEFEIRPTHDSIHQLEINLFHKGLLFYHDILEFHVAPQWMSPTFLLPLLVIIIFILSVVMVTGTSLLYINNQLALRRLFWEQHTQLKQLIDQLTISNLEVNIAKETKESPSDDPSSRPLGFFQHLQLSEPLDREALKQQFYSLRDQIVNGDPQNFQRLLELLTQGEELLEEL